MNKVKVLGINFFNGTAQEAVDSLKKGGLLVVPAAPALINIRKDSGYFESLLKSDLAIPDSGYMVLIWNFFKRPLLKKISGWKFLVTFLADKQIVDSNSVLLVDPNADEASANLAYLNSIGFKLSNDHSYIAPWYKGNKLVDTALLEIIKEQKPRYIIVNLGGGVQEKLGLYLKENLPYSPAIICTGAAIAFLTGRQAKMPTWADKLFLGWLMRCIDNPSVFIPRYFKAFKLVKLIIQYGEKSPITNTI